MHSLIFVCYNRIYQTRLRTNLLVFYTFRNKNDYLFYFLFNYNFIFKDFILFMILSSNE